MLPVKLHFPPLSCSFSRICYFSEGKSPIFTGRPISLEAVAGDWFEVWWAHLYYEWVVLVVGTSTLSCDLRNLHCRHSFGNGTFGRVNSTSCCYFSPPNHTFAIIVRAENISPHFDYERSILHSSRMIDRES